MKIKVENCYSDGHESVKFYDDVPEFPGVEPHHDDLDDALWDHLFDYTGDGHGEDADLGWFYAVTVLESEDPQLVGHYIENSGN